MYCSHCGKKVGDAMLFCPFCGEPIVIPEQDAPKPADPTAGGAPAPEPVPGADPPGGAEDAEVPKPFEPMPMDGEEEADEGDAARELLDWSRERARSADAWARPEPPGELFEPLRLDGEEEEEKQDWREDISCKKQAVTPQKKPPEMKHGGEKPVRLEGAAPRLELDVEGAKPAASGKARRKHANTLVPSKAMDPDDMFMDSSRPDHDDDPYDDDGDDDLRDAFVYEDEEESSFFMRHLRGIVGLSMFVILILIFVIYAFSRAGQITLARANLAWGTEAYSALGLEYYQSGQYEEAGRFYERALQRDRNNYGLASSAAMAYVNAEDTERAAAMLKRCAEIDPTRLEPYVYLLKLYPDAASRPWDITQLLQKGYGMTGDKRLNVTG